MTAFAIELGLLGVRVTIVALATLVLLLACRRRAARSAVILLATAMLFLLILSATSVLPLPDAWRWAASDGASASDNRIVAISQPADEPGDATALTSLLYNAGRWLTNWQRTLPDPQGQWIWTLVVAIYLVGAGICAIKLLFGWAGVVKLRRRSRTITDPRLLKLTDELRTHLACTAPVETRESDDLGPAATFGWLRPVILLSSDWREWSTEELRAVLAHELAHVRHRDFLLGLLAGFCKALHFYHPLVRWLTRHLSWHQEVAADDLAATITGGRSAYLKTLARLALRPPARMPVGASLSLPAMTGGTLVRRIDMLCRTEQRPMRPVMRGVLFTLLATATLATSAWRGPAETITPTPNDELPPFELGYLAPEAKGIFAIRPSLFLQQPGTDKIREKIDEAFQEMKKMGIDLPDIVKPHNVEQFVADFRVSTAGTGKPGSRQVSFGSSSMLIRFHKDIDAAAVLRPLVPGMKETRKGDVTICHLGTIPELGPMPMSMLLPDRRTVVFVLHHPKDDDEATARRLEAVLQRVPTTRKRDWGSGWKQVEQAAFALVIDNTEGNYRKQFAKDVEDEPEMQTMLDNLRFATIGIELGDGRPVRIILDALSATALKATEKAGVELLQKGLAEAKKDFDATEPAQKALLKLFTEVVTLGRAQRSDSRLEWIAYPSVRVGDLITSDGLLLQSIEKKTP